MAAVSVANQVSRTVSLTDPAPLPHQRPAIEQGPGHGDFVELLPVMSGFAPLQVDQGHRLIFGILIKYDFTISRIYD